ncbi:hypothetical protein [Kiloniella sp.]|uniref:hypothetical protein n=1 Tax=Kiloniella sp. TaxID=1938587 RepID=UPI003B01FF61
MLIVIYLLYVKLSETIHINRLLGGRHLFLLNKAEKSQSNLEQTVEFDRFRKSQNRGARDAHDHLKILSGDIPFSGRGLQRHRAVLRGGAPRPDDLGNSSQCAECYDYSGRKRFRKCPYI